MERHFHVWTRAGKAFLMQERRFESRHTATSVARRVRPNGADRLVLACEDCPATKPVEEEAAAVGDNRPAARGAVRSAGR